MSDDTTEDNAPQSVGLVIANTAELTKTLMKNFGLNFNQAWTIVRDGMDRQQHFGDNQVRLMLGGYQAMETINKESILEVEEIPDDEEDGEIDA